MLPVEIAHRSGRKTAEVVHARELFVYYCAEAVANDGGYCFAAGVAAVVVAGDVAVAGLVVAEPVVSGLVFERRLRGALDAKDVAGHCSGRDLDCPGQGCRWVI